jgi:ABC-type transport system substrate-binding protein
VHHHIALRVQRDLLKVGVDMQIQVLSSGAIGKLIVSGRFDAVLLDMISGPTPGRPYTFWASRKNFQGESNFFGYENEEAERLFTTITTTLNEAAVRSATARLQRVFREDPPALFLAWNERARAIRRSVQIPNEPDRDPMSTLARWTAASSRSGATR